jgi:hypothetical protein
VDHDRTHDRTKDWRELCRAAATELDPVKLMRLIAELTRALNERDKHGQRTTVEVDKARTEAKSGSAISLQRELVV